MESPGTGAVQAGSIIIPAWNEASVIERTLESLFEELGGVPNGSGVGGGPGDLRPSVVVAANGCTDDTVELARRTGERARAVRRFEVLDLPPIGKALAIREAESAAPGLPRLYLDADVELHGSAAAALLDALRNGAIAARPPIDYDVSGASWLVQAFYRVRTQLPNVSSDLCGAGVYGLGEEARSRFDDFPDVRSDDLFVARVVDAEEISIVPCRPVVVRVPKSAASLIRTLGRIYGGNRELASSAGDSVESTATQTGRDLSRLARSPKNWIDVLAYIGLVVAGRVRSLRTSTGWERDETAREVGLSR